ncbi:MAG: uroporphyrinogen decarboxylase family protein [bacterium]|nr:uroporphyrinogen decarboxylase family protein [bacterium]
MNNIERASNILNRRATDRPAYYDTICNDAVIEHFSGRKLTPDNALEVLPLAFKEFLEATRIIIITPNRIREEIQANGTKIRYDRWTAWYDYPFTQSPETLAKYLEEEIANIEALSEDEIAGMVSSAEQTFMEWKSRLGEDTYLFGNFGTKPWGSLQAVSLNNFAYLWADNPELMIRYFDAVTEAHVRRIRHISESSIQAVFTCDDIAFKNTLMLSPNLLRKHYFPRLERIVSELHDKGIKFIHHSDGCIMPVLDDLVAAGIDGLNPLETIAGVDIVEIRRRHKDLILIGGIDCSQLLPLGTPAEIRKITEETIRNAAPWYFCGSSSEVVNSVPLENFMTMLDTIRNFHY